MPIPKPVKNERKVDYLPRCMGNKTMGEDYPNTEQRYAVCQSTWDRRRARAEAAMHIKESMCEPLAYAQLIGVAEADLAEWLEEVEELLKEEEPK